MKKEYKDRYAHMLRRPNICRFIWIWCMILMAACSTTQNLPEGEILYTGVDEIDYLKPGETIESHKNDTSGVINALASAAEQINNLLSGSKGDVEDKYYKNPKSLTEEEKAIWDERRKNYREALESASTEVNAVLEYAPNNALFWSAYHRTPLPIGLWVYNAYVNKTSPFSKWMFKSLASEPVLISTVNPETRVKVATNTLHNFGFFHGKVGYEVKNSTKNPRKAKVSYYIQPGRVFRLDSITYRNFPLTADSLIRKTMGESYLKKNASFSVANLTAEQSRLEELFRNEGYYYYNASSATYKADTVAHPYKVQLEMSPKQNISSMVNHPWYMGHTYISVYRNDEDTLNQSRDIRNYTINYSGKKMPLYPLVWAQNIAHRHGRIYRQKDEERTQELLSSLGIFSQINVKYARRDTTKTCDSLDLMVTAVLDKPFTTDVEMNVTTKNSDRIGPGLSLNLQRRNAFRGAELVNFKLYGNYEWRFRDESASKDAFFNSYELGTELSFDFPRVVFPGISRRQFRFPTKTKFSIGGDWLNRSGYFNLVTMNVQAAYSWHKKRTLQHEFIPFSLAYNKLYHCTDEFATILAENPGLLVSLMDRFVPSMQYSLTYSSSPRHRNPTWFQLMAKEAGNITSCIYAMAGRKFSEPNKELAQNPFAQYLKLTAELRNTFKITGSQRLATRLMAGIVYSYGNSLAAPYNDQFFVGGANSVRGFAFRNVGPGRYYIPDSRYGVLSHVGDIKLEGNVEYRFPMFGSLSGALFVDAGNVWLVSEDEYLPGGQFSFKRMLKDLALGTGCGIRYDMDFLVLRLDLGVALHDPASNGRSRYYNIGKFKDGLCLHFAIGYPF